MKSNSDMILSTFYQLTHHVSQAPRQVVGIGCVEGLALRHHALQVLEQHRDAHACRRE